MHGQNHIKNTFLHFPDIQTQNQICISVVYLQYI